MDTVIEVMVFSAAAMGVLTVLIRGYSTSSSNPLVPSRENIKITNEFSIEAIQEVKDTTNLNTPFTQMVARIVLPLSL